jgi:hypothetical protein
MFSLLDEHFADASLNAFERDLEEKEWALLLEDEGGRIQGFSTLARMQATHDGAPVLVLYSGDTIVRRGYWASGELARGWSRFAFELAETAGMPTYWLLIASGFRTYRFLPVFFRDFYPRFDRATPPAVKGFLDEICTSRFGSSYDPSRGIVRLPGASSLRSGIAEVTEARLQDPHIAFFVDADPGHASGDELACLTRIARDNLTRAGRRVALPGGSKS